MSRLAPQFNVLQCNPKARQASKQHRATTGGLLQLLLGADVAGMSTLALAAVGGALVKTGVAPGQKSKPHHSFIYLLTGDVAKWLQSEFKSEDPGINPLAGQGERQFVCPSESTQELTCLCLPPPPTPALCAYDTHPKFVRIAHPSVLFFFTFSFTVKE